MDFALLNLSQRTMLASVALSALLGASAALGIPFEGTRRYYLAIFLKS